MTDPNVTYKLAFAELQAKLGRVPTASECLGLHDAYKKAFASAAGPGESGFSREPAPQAGAIGAEVRARGGQLSPEERAYNAWASQGQPEPLSGPTINAEAPERRSAPEPPANKPEPPERPVTGTRGPSGGIVAVCRGCGQDFERPARKGRPPVKCEECR